MPINMLGNGICVINTDKLSYALLVAESGAVNHLYFGSKIDRIEDFCDAAGSLPSAIARQPEEYSSFGCLREKSAALKVAFADRTRDFRCGRGRAEINGDTLTITLNDSLHPFEVKLCYKAYEAENIIERWCELRNTGAENVKIERAFSAELCLPGDGYSVMNYSGHWAAEQQPVSMNVNGGRIVFENRHGLTAHGNNPFFAAYRDANEDSGEIYFGALEYSGNFKVSAEASPYGYMNVLMGMSDEDFCWTLNPGETLDTPHAILGFTRDGFTGMSHALTGFAFSKVMPRNFVDKPLPVLFNSWYATLFDVFADDQKKLADKAAAIGCELFMIDDGWFGERNDDKHGLGDWYVNPVKFPNGLGDLIDHCHELGMDFGLWAEPEMVNPESELYKAHPDWVLQYTGREILMGRNQYVLNLSKPEVVDYLIDIFDRLLSDYDISCVKWDMNRYLSEALSDSGEDGRFWREYQDGFERIITTLRARHQSVSFEACASGGGRVDYGAMRNFDMYWPSDNVDGVDRLAIQEGYSYIYPVKYMRAWVTDATDIPLQFRCHCAMCGALGIGVNLNVTAQQDLDIMRRNISEYKRIRDTVQFGKLYRIDSLRTGAIQSLCYVGAERALLFAFQIHPEFYKENYIVRMKGLDAQKIYEYDTGDGVKRMHSGAYLMEYGVKVHLPGNFASCMIEFAAQN